MEQSQTTIESSTFLPFPQLGQAASKDLVTYLMVTAEVGLPNAVKCQCLSLKKKMKMSLKGVCILVYLMPVLRVCGL